MVEDYTRFVAVVGDEEQETTFVLDGTMTLKDVFKFINERRVVRKVQTMRVHVDSAAQPPWTERFGLERGRVTSEVADAPA
jgi:hypothetical protein